MSQDQSRNQVLDQGSEDQEGDGDPAWLLGYQNCDGNEDRGGDDFKFEGHRLFAVANGASGVYGGHAD